MDKISWKRRLVTETGVTLPYAEKKRWDGESIPAGTAFIPLDLLEELSEATDPWGSVLIINDQYAAWALEQAGWAVRQTRGGYVSSAVFRDLLPQMYDDLPDDWDTLELLEDKK